MVVEKHEIIYHILLTKVMIILFKITFAYSVFALFIDSEDASTHKQDAQHVP